VGGHIIEQQEKISSRTHLDEPVECTSGDDPLLLYKILHLLFFPLIQILVHYTLRVKKNYQHGFFGWGDVSPTHSELCHFFSGAKAKHQVSSPIIILLKKFLSASAITIMSWQDVIQSSLCSGVKEYGTKRAHNFLFPKSSFRIQRTYSLGDVQRFCHHSWCDLMVIFYQISNSSNVYLSLSLLWTATSLVIFYQLSSVSKSRIPPKNVWWVQSLIPISLLHQYLCFCHR